MAGVVRIDQATAGEIFPCRRKWWDVLRVVWGVDELRASPPAGMQAEPPHAPGSWCSSSSWSSCAHLLTHVLPARAFPYTSSAPLTSKPLHPTHFAPLLHILPPPSILPLHTASPTPLLYPPHTQHPSTAPLAHLLPHFLTPCTPCTSSAPLCTLTETLKSLSLPTHRPPDPGSPPVPTASALAWRGTASHASLVPRTARASSLTVGHGHFQPPRPGCLPLRVIPWTWDHLGLQPPEKPSVLTVLGRSVTSFLQTITRAPKP